MGVKQDLSFRQSVQWSWIPITTGWVLSQERCSVGKAVVERNLQDAGPDPELEEATTLLEQPEV